MIKTKPKRLKIFAPVMVSGNRGIDYMTYMLSRDWQITKKQRLLDYMHFGVYRQTDGFHLVGFMHLDSNPLAKPEKETGLRVSNVHQIGAYSKVDRDPRRDNE